MDKKLLIENKEYLPISSAARLLNSKPPIVYYYIKKGRLKTVDIDSLKLIELDSLQLLNHYLKFRYKK
jgi:hypothetical protein